MAIQLTAFVKGKVGNIIMYKLGDTPVARSRPAKVRKTANMKICSTNFGKASAAGKLLRHSLNPALHNPKDVNMQRRFSGAINKWMGKTPLRNIPPQPRIDALYGFEFNLKASFFERFKKLIETDLSVPGTIALRLPAFIASENIAAPAHTIAVELAIAIAGCQLSSLQSPGNGLYKKRYDYSDAPQPAETLIYHINLPARSLLVTVASLTYYLANGRVEKREAFMPCSVIDARYV